ncbi:hypothetical protein [Novosphingobium marinum]|uniref:Uncharacterized protein n=1 Tax=Novosphingobium marinum TaxID=1514948 RepID=A0A7Y9XU80_9SPHN|nr:hypothetical protein [Novosphingobium marinum]NYH94572.1 hypothetical protein [Novosphingobium marinum]
MTETMRWGWIATGLAALLILLIVLAWHDAGREPVAPIVEPVPVPDLPA